MKRPFVYADTAHIEAPLTPRLSAFIDKWNTPWSEGIEAMEKYHHDGTRLHVYDRIYTRQERWGKGRGQYFEYERQELIDSLDHPGREADVDRLCELARIRGKANQRVVEYSCGDGGRLSLETPDGIACFGARVSNEDETSYTLDIATSDSILGGYSKAVREHLGFERSEVHSHHLEVSYHKTLPKLGCPLTRNWLYLVHYRGWLLRVAEERGTQLLLVGHDPRLQREGVLEGISPYVASAKWVERGVCAPAEEAPRTWPVLACYPISTAELQDVVHFEESPPRGPDGRVRLLDEIFAESHLSVRRHEADVFDRLRQPFDPMRRYSEGFKVQIVNEEQERYWIRVIPAWGGMDLRGIQSMRRFLEEAGFREVPAMRTAQACGYLRDIPKLPNHLNERRLHLVRYRGWVLRAIEETGSAFLLVGCGEKISTVLDVLLPYAAGARWVARSECEILESGEEGFRVGTSLVFDLPEQPVSADSRGKASSTPGPPLRIVK